MSSYYVYILTNARNSTLYTGITNNLAIRYYQHKNKKGSWFTTKYNINKLVYFEEYSDITEAIAREKQIKAGSRRKKLKLIENKNPQWRDLGNNF